MKYKVYISGKISGIENEAPKLFEEAESEIMQFEIFKNDSVEIVNPMKLPHEHNKTWENYMREDLKALLDCTHIYMLKNWDNSDGATIEHQLAKWLKLKIIYQQ